MTREAQEEAAYFAGFKHGSEHADEDFDRAPGARDLGLYPGDFGLRDEWNHGRQDGACAVRLGHDAQKMLKHKFRGPSLIDPACEIVGLLTERDHARAELASLRGLVRAFQEAEDAFFSAEGNVAILGADSAMEAAKRRLFDAIKETP